MESRAPSGGEVSCRALELVFVIARDHGRTPEALLEGLPLTAAEARDLRRRIPWSVYARICERLAAVVGSVEALADEGARLLEAPSLRGVTTIAALFTSLRSFYWVAHRWAGASLFGIPQTEFHVVGPSSLRLRVTVPEPYEVSPAFFYLTAGTFRAAPRILGLPDSVVEPVVRGRTCDYVIHHAPSVTLWSRLRHALLPLFAARKAFDEMRAQNDALAAQVRELAEARRAADEALALKNQFLTAVTHELRTPLAGVLGMADLLTEQVTGEEAAENVVAIREQASTLLAVVNDVLDLQNVAQGRLEVREGRYDPAAVARAVVDAHRGRAARARLALTLVTAPDLPPLVVGDGRRVAQALRHLVDNGLKYTPRGSVTVSVTTKPGGRLRFAVADTGVGIEPAWRQRVFQPFVQRDGARLTRRQGGVGLGLAVARGVTAALGGELGMESRVGAGSTFTLDLPCCPARPPPPSEAPREGAPATATEARAGLRVLVVEDNPVNQKILVRILEKMGHGSEVADNGRAAVEALARAPFDAVLMDLQMPEMDGFEATREIRRREGDARRTPIFAVTANYEPEFQALARDVGMDGFLGKPVGRAGLAEVLARVPRDSTRYPTGTNSSQP